jgi:hypothetical protein
MARLQDGTTARADDKPANILSGVQVACICICMEALGRDTPQPSIGKSTEAELPLPAHPINQIAGWLLGICRFAIAGSINAS